MARSQIPYTAADTLGAVVAGTTVTITNRDGGSLATIYAAETGNNVFSTVGVINVAANGRIPGWLEEGSYNLAFGAPLNYTRTLDIVRGDGAGRIAAEVATTAKLQDGQATASKFATGAITSAKIAASQVTEPKLANNAASSRTLGALQVTNPKIADGQVGTSHLALNSITAAKMAPNSVGTPELVNSAVTTAKFAPGAITTAKIADDAILTANIAASALTSAKLGTLTVKHEHLAPTVLPVGTIWPTVLTIAELPGGSENWKLCDGQELAINDYPELWAVMGHGSYGFSYPISTQVYNDNPLTPRGGSPNVFYLPDLRGRHPIGLAPGQDPGYGANALGANEGHTVATRQPKHGHSVDEVSVSSISHGTHTYTYPISAGDGTPPTSGQGSWRYQGTYSGTTAVSGSHTHGFSGVAGSSAGPLDCAAYLTVNFMIKVR